MASMEMIPFFFGFCTLFVSALTNYAPAPTVAVLVTSARPATLLRSREAARPPGFFNSLLGTICPRLTVAGQERPGSRARQPVEGGQRPLAVGRRPTRDDSGTPNVGVDVVRDQRVSRDDRVALWQVERDVAQGVARREHDARGAGQVEGAFVSEPAHFADWAHARRPGPNEGGHDRQGLATKVRERAAFAHVQPRPLRQRYVVLVDPYRDAQLRPRPLGEAYVVEVGVREHERLDVAGGAAEPPQGPEQGLPGGRQ